MRTTRLAALSLAAALAGTLASCGGGGDDGGAGGGASSTSTDAAAADVEGAGTRYEGTLEDDSTLVVRLGVPADDPAVADFDAFRSLTGAEEPTWIVAEVTVPEGTDGTGRYLTFAAPGVDPLDDDPSDPDDGVSSSTFACSTLDDWYALADPSDEAVTEAYQGLYEGPCAGQTMQVLAPGGESTTYVMIYDGELPEFETVRAGLASELSPA